MVFAVHGRVVGADLFDRSETLAKLWPKLVRAYALDALEEPDKAAPPPRAEAVQDWLRRACDAALKSYPSPGVGEDVRLTGPGVVGELMLWRRDRWETTKDLARIDADGYFYHAGRADDVIISAGWTMSAVEMEDMLLRHPEVLEAAVIGVADATRGQVAKAFVVARGAQDAALTRDIQDFVRTRLSRHEYPRIVAFVSELPKTPAGKVNRQALRERAMQEVA